MTRTLWIVTCMIFLTGCVSLQWGAPRESIALRR